MSYFLYSANYISAKPSGDLSAILSPTTTKHGLYIGTQPCIQNSTLIKALRIGAVVTIDSSTSIRFNSDFIKTHFIMPVTQQSCSLQILKYLDSTVDFISKMINETNVLVHCDSGSRLSPAIAVAYLMKERGLTVEKAYQHVKQCRSATSIDMELFMRLKEYEAEWRLSKEQYLCKENNAPIPEIEESGFSDESKWSVKNSQAGEERSIRVVDNPGFLVTESFEGYF